MMEDRSMYGIQYGGTCYGYGDEAHHHQPSPPTLNTADAGGNCSVYGDDHYSHYPHPQGNNFAMGPPVFSGPGILQLPCSSSDAASGMVQEKAGDQEESVSLSVAMARAKIAAHPLYPNLLQAYIDCQKVGAPVEVASVLDKIRPESNDCGTTDNYYLQGADPELDEFMEAYCDALTRYKSSLSRPFEEATSFLKKIENQLHALCNDGSSSNCASAFLPEGKMLMGVRDRFACAILEVEVVTAVFDEDGDGYISARELQVVLGKLGLSEGNEIAKVQQMIVSVDRNQDGRVDFFEFKDMMRGVMARS